MKFRYNGQDGCVDLDLIQHGILNEQDKLRNGQEIEVEDDHELIPRLQNTGAWTQIEEKTASNAVKTKPITEEVEE